jgi:lipopolysaccharide/colanic/teichoic acid biosynthesis glycosyltransferase
MPKKRVEPRAIPSLQVPLQVRQGGVSESLLLHLNHRSTGFKISHDPRLTGLGRILRKYSIDEWPSYGMYSRATCRSVEPAVPEQVELDQCWQRRRLRMRPGLTCLWAVAGRDSIDLETWMKMDMQYIDNRSLTLDWKIILRTILGVLTGQGKFESVARIK